MHSDLHTAIGHFATRQNRENTEKPNEDFAFVDNRHGIYVVCDGVTRSLVNGEYPNPSPSARASEIFAGKVSQVLIEFGAILTPADALRKAVQVGNRAIAEFNAQTFTKIDYLENDLAGTVAIVAIIVNNDLHYAYNGDCYGYIVSADEITRFTNPQTAGVADYRGFVGFTKNATLEIRRDFRNNRKHPLGYGVFTGEESALDFVEYGKINLRAVQAIILASDGGAHLFDINPEILLTQSAQAIIRSAEQIEFERRVRSDDKTVVVIQIRTESMLNANH